MDPDGITWQVLHQLRSGITWEDGCPLPHQDPVVQRRHSKYKAYLENEWGRGAEVGGAGWRAGGEAKSRKDPERG